MSGSGESEERLREPEFLLWLEQFVGKWRHREGIFSVSRREDGLLQAFEKASNRKAPIREVVTDGTFLEPHESPLGPYPVCLSTDQMEHWLPRRELNRLGNAWRVGSGLRRILRTLEDRISALSPALRRRKWLEWWALGSKTAPPLAKPDAAAHTALYRKFEGGRAARDSRAAPEEGPVRAGSTPETGTES